MLSERGTYSRAWLMFGLHAKVYPVLAVVSALKCEREQSADSVQAHPISRIPPLWRDVNPSRTGMTNIANNYNYHAIMSHSHSHVPAVEPSFWTDFGPSKSRRH